MRRLVDRIVDELDSAGARDISGTSGTGVEEIYFKGLSVRDAKKVLKNAGFFENPSGGLESRDGGPILVVHKDGKTNETAVSVYTRRKYKRDYLQGQNTVSGRMESRDTIDDLLDENYRLKAALRKSGMALALTEGLNRLPESRKTEAVSRLQEAGSFKSVTRFSEHVDTVIEAILEEDAHRETSDAEIQESAPAKPEPQPTQSDDLSESDPLGLFHSDFVLARKIIGSNGKINEAFGLDEWIKSEYGRGPLRELYGMWSTKQALPKRKIQEASDDIEALQESVQDGTLKSQFNDTAKKFLSYVASQKAKFRI